MAAAVRLGHQVVLVIPREGMSAARARQEMKQALDDFGIREQIAVKTIPRPAVKQRFRRSFDFLAACWVRARNFDLVWSREFHAADYATAFGLNVILEHHHPFTDRQWKVARRMLRRETFRGVAAISRVHKQILLKDGWPEEKVVVAHSGVDLSLFAAAPEVQSLRAQLATPTQPIVLYAGSLYRGKGAELMLQAAFRLEHVKFVCVGGGDSEVASFCRQAEGLTLANIEFVGAVAHAEVPRYLQAADILVAPFTVDARDVAGKIIISFSSPIKLFEYMAAGKPIVASNIGAIPEVLTHETNGLLVGPGNLSELVAAISRLLRDRSLAETLAQNARRDAHSYTWDARVALILGFALEHSRPRAGESSEDQRLAPVWKLRRGD